MGEGTKGPRLFDWAMVPLLHRWEPDASHRLLQRRCLNDPHDMTYYLVFAPKATTLPELVEAIGARWNVETDFENAKDLGMDHYEVRSFLGWYRHITLVLLALAFLTGICVSSSPPLCVTAAVPVSALSVPEVGHLLARLIWPAKSSAHHTLSWSWWRRCHQGRASAVHRKRRRKAG